MQRQHPAPEQYDMTPVLHFYWIATIPDSQKQLRRPHGACQSKGWLTAVGEWVCEEQSILLSSCWPLRILMLFRDVLHALRRTAFERQPAVDRDFVNPFTTWSLDVRKWDSGMQGWLQQKWLQEFLSFPSERIVCYWSCVRPQCNSFNMICNPNEHAKFKHEPSLAFVWQKAFLAITAHFIPQVSPCLSLAVLVVPMEGFTMVLPGYEQMGSWAFW